MNNKLVKTLAMAFVLVWAGMASAQKYDAGIDYLLVKPPQPTRTGEKVEVLEVFWYGCPHCYQFEPALKRWSAKLPEHARFERMPAIFSGRPAWAMHARAYYTAELMGVLDRVHQPLFDALHKEKRRLFDQASLAQFFAEQGVDKQEFNKTFNSFAVDTRVRRAREMSRRYGISGVPSLIINGKYRLSGSITGSTDRMLQIADYLIDKEAGAR